MKRWGLEVGSQTLWDQLHALGRRLAPCYDALFERVRTAPVMGLDQTSWKRLNRKNGTPWQMWCLTTEDVIYHRIREDKSARSWNALIGDYRGIVVTRSTRMALPNATIRAQSWLGVGRTSATATAG